MTQDHLFSSADINIMSQQSIILIAEPDQEISNHIAQLLEKDGHLVMTTSNGEECLEAYKNIMPNLVILDARMPKINGFECCRKLLKSPANATPLTLIITGLDEEESVNLAFESGASDFITKPIRWPILKQSVHIHLENNRLKKQLEETTHKLLQLSSMYEFRQLTNRQFFLKQIQVEWLRMVREESHLSLMICEIDGFETYVDTYGHIQSDQCLSQVDNAIHQSLNRPADLTTRYGGGKIAALLPNTSLEGSLHIAEKIRGAVAALAIPHQSNAFSDVITISLGIASVLPCTQLMGAGSFYQSADKALSKAKAEGGDRIVVGTPID
ncbi:diguanylate cyclase domain-containing protein [Acaryochloris sp. CCMEE 5410]|uniref:GGDEF domain-containing response regulator n=1 Tax=Acaryochloris sp. CCMEE 5410 TaxID=310037 RepID=UPI002934A6C6|nr:diguanylate cyclase [Acaryochloris sp. CCMEE 5410]